AARRAARRSRALRRRRARRPARRAARACTHSASRRVEYAMRSRAVRRMPWQRTLKALRAGSAHGRIRAAPMRSRCAVPLLLVLALRAIPALAISVAPQGEPAPPSPQEQEVLSAYLRDPAATATRYP